MSTGCSIFDEEAYKKGICCRVMRFGNAINQNYNGWSIKSCQDAMLSNTDNLNDFESKYKIKDQRATLDVKNNSVT